jgi:hypothetical protein
MPRAISKIKNKTLDICVDAHAYLQPVRKRLRIESGCHMNKQHKELRANLNLARATWGLLGKNARHGLEELTIRYSLSVALGDILLLDGRWYVTHAGLLRLATRDRCSGIRVLRMRELCDPSANRWVFRATVYKSPRSRGFVGYGDADPSNVSSLVHGAEMRIAETRAVNRALRKAYGIGLCSVEELGWAPRSSASGSSEQRKASTNGNNGHQSSQPRLRDRLCLLIRQHHLDAALVKAYAADYCGTSTLREASREQVEAFINDLAERAAKDRDGLICQLNSYAKQTEVVNP